MADAVCETAGGMVRWHRRGDYYGARCAADSPARNHWCVLTRFLVGSGVLALWLLVIPYILSHTIPADHWFEVNRVYFEDTVEGVPPHLTVDRSIHRPFRGAWDAEVKREVGSTFQSHCLRHSPGPFDYRTDARIPPDADLRWWLEIPPNRDCEWAPGRYIVETTWRIYLWLGITLRVKAVSNTFTIHAAHGETLTQQFRVEP